MLLAVQPPDTGLNPASKSSQPQKWQHRDCPLCLSCRPNKARHPTVRPSGNSLRWTFFESSLSLSLPDAFKSSSALARVFWKWFKAIDFRLWNLYSLPEGKDTEDLFPSLKAKTPRGSIQGILFCLALGSFFLKCGIQQALLSFWSSSDSISSLVASVRLSGWDPRWCVHVSDMLECHRLLLLGFVVGEKPPWVCSGSSHLARTPTWKRPCCCISL